LDPLRVQVIWNAGLNKHPAEAYERDEVLDVHTCLTRRRAFHDGFLIPVRQMPAKLRL